MSDCAFCDKGVQPFYELGEKVKQSICHTCFHLGKHKIPREPDKSTQKPQPVAGSPSTATKK